MLQDLLALVKELQARFVRDGGLSAEQLQVSSKIAGGKPHTHIFCETSAPFLFFSY